MTVAERVLAGGAGREVCLEVAMIPGYGEVKMPWRFHRFSGWAEPSRQQLLEELEQVVATGNFRRFLADADPSRLARLVAHATSGLTRPVDDRAVTLPETEAAVLLPVASAALGSVATQWWTSTCAVDDQHLVDVLPSPRYASPPDLPPTAALAAGVEEEAKAERRLRHDHQVRFPPPENYGHLAWIAWSVPNNSVGDHSFAGRAVPLPAVGLISDWDGEGEYHSQQWRARVAESARVLPVGDGRTTLLYWQPDETYWLNDVIALDRSPTIWPDDEQRLPDDDYADLVFGDDGSLSLPGCSTTLSQAPKT